MSVSHLTALEREAFHIVRAGFADGPWFRRSIAKRFFAYRGVA